MPAVDPLAEPPQTFGLFIHVVIGREIRQDEIIWPKLRDGSDLLVNSLRLRISDDAKGDRVVVRGRFQISVLSLSEHAVLGAIRIERADEIAVFSRELRQRPPR